MIKSPIHFSNHIFVCVDGNVHNKTSYLKVDFPNSIDMCLKQIELCSQTFLAQ